jgi:hypothetical protein
LRDILLGGHAPRQELLFAAPADHANLHVGFATFTLDEVLALIAHKKSPESRGGGCVHANPFDRSDELHAGHAANFGHAPATVTLRLFTLVADARINGVRIMVRGPA